MKLDDMNFLEMLPAFMRTDGANIGLAKGIDSVTEELAAKMKLLSTWDQIDKMSISELDMLAQELHISWYDTNATADVKRTLIKESDIVHTKLGTNWAALRVITAYFGESKIVDWFDYDGEPGHFKIQTLNQSILNNKAQEFMKILNLVKRKSAHLDAIELVSDGQSDIHVFIGSVESDVVTYTVRR